VQSLGTVLDELEQMAWARSDELPQDAFILRGLWGVDYRSLPNEHERFMTYSFMMAQTIFQGCCYADFGAVELNADSDALLGRDVRTLRGLGHVQRIAILDAVYGSLIDEPDKVISLSGLPAGKVVRRAEVIVAEVARELERKAGLKVVNVGVLGNFIYEMRRHGIDVAASDLDSGLVGSYVHGVLVEDGTRSAELVAGSDVALVCGETLATDTLDDILAAARSSGTSVVLFAVSGCHFAREYCQTFGIDVAISEPQPQYLFQGESTIGIYRRRR
jgi:hypothetical protein